MLFTYCSISLVYSLLKVLYFSNEMLIAIENKFRHPKTTINYLLLIIFFILFPFFLLSDLKNFFLDMRILYHKRKARRELKKLDKTFQKYNIDKEDYFNKTFNEIQKENHD